MANLYILTERNSWEQERWNFFIRMTEDQAKEIRELIAGDSSYSLKESPMTEEEVRTRVENSICRGYMPCWNDAGTLLRVPERVGDHPADQLYKGRISLFCQEPTP